MMKLYALEKDRADAASKKEEYMRQKMARGAQIANSVKKCREEEVRRKNNESMGRAVQKDKELQQMREINNRQYVMIEQRKEIERVEKFKYDDIERRKAVYEKNNEYSNRLNGAK